MDLIQALFLLFVCAVSITDTVGRFTLRTAIDTVTMAWASGDATFEVVIAFNKALYILVAISLAHIKQYVTVRGALMANNFVTVFSLKISL